MSRAVTYVKLAIAANLWGTTFSISSVLLRSIDVFALISLRMIFGLVALLIYCGATHRLGKIGLMFKENRNWLLIIGIMFFAVAYIVQYTALTPVNGVPLTTTFNQAVLLNLQSFFVIIINWLYFKKKLSKMVLIGAIVAFLGTVLIDLKPGAIGPRQFTLWGDLITIGSTVLWACFTAFSKPISEKPTTDPIVFNMINIILSCCVLVPIGALSPTGFVKLVDITWIGWLGLIWLGSVCIGVAYVLWFDGLKEIDSSRVIVFVYMEPIFASILAIFWLGESLSVFSFVGMALCFAGIFIAQLERKPRAANTEEANQPIPFMNPAGDEV
jgi:drug/metabolite transporter (DMT)-like permease